MDYRSVGFRECASEVARYLVTVEGLDIQDPLRLRLMSHLQCYSAQRETKPYNSPSTTTTQNSWNSLNTQYATAPNPSGASLNTPLLPPTIPATNHPMLGHQQDHLSPLAPSGQLPHHHQTVFTPPDSTQRLLTPLTPQSHLPSPSHPPPSSSASSSHQTSPPASHASYPAPGGAFGAPPSHMMSPSMGSYQSASTIAGQLRPYRPWGAELAY